VATAREEPDLRDGLGVVFVRVDEFLGVKVLGFVALAGKFNVEVCIAVSQAR
jgi:hypothetical protein